MEQQLCEKHPQLVEELCELTGRSCRVEEGSQTKVLFAASSAARSMSFTQITLRWMASFCYDIKYEGSLPLRSFMFYALRELKQKEAESADWGVLRQMVKARRNKPAFTRARQDGEGTQPKTPSAKRGEQNRDCASQVRTASGSERQKTTPEEPILSHPEKSKLRLGDKIVRWRIDGEAEQPTADQKKQEQVPGRDQAGSQVQHLRAKFREAGTFRVCP